LAAAVNALGPLQSSVDVAWRRPAAQKVIDCVLSLNRRYDGFVVPRLEQFALLYPSVATVKDLFKLIESFDSPASFVGQVLNYRDPARASILFGVSGYLVGICEGSIGSEDDRLLAWARAAKPQEYRAMGVKGFGLAGFQYLRMLFGANTTKPDVHIIRFVRNAINRDVNSVQALALLEQAAAAADVSLRDFDTTVWESSARLQ
jgi:hypothetical protein